MKKIFIITGIVILILFLIFYSRTILLIPRITILNPTSDEIQTDSNSVELVGLVEHANFFSINDRPVILEINGSFRESLAVPDGYSEIKLFASDRKGIEIIKIIEVLVDNN